MDGMTILNQTEIMLHPEWWIFVMIALLVICAISFTVLLACHDEVGGIIAGFLSLSTLIAFIVIGRCVDEIPTGRYKYEVLLEEDISFRELYENYEILEQRGDIWVLEDKEE